MQGQRRGDNDAYLFAYFAEFVGYMSLNKELAHG
jgi:hypothetical protein